MITTVSFATLYINWNPSTAIAILPCPK